MGPRPVDATGLTSIAHGLLARVMMTMTELPPLGRERSMSDVTNSLRLACMFFLVPAARAEEPLSATLQQAAD
jgi:hypothetical protein